MRNKLIILTIATSIAINQPILQAKFSFTNNKIVNVAKGALSGCSNFMKNRRGKGFLISSGIGSLIGIIAYIIYKYREVNDRPGENERLLTEACRLNNFDQVKYLVEEKKANINSIHYDYRAYNNPLYKACQNNNLQIVKYLVEKGANINKPLLRGGIYRDPIDIACRNNHLQVVKYLLKKGAKPNIEISKTIFSKSCRSDRADIVKQMTEKNKINPKGIIYNEHHTPLHISCKSGKLNTSQYLIEQGLDVNARNSHFQTPLHEACVSGNLDLVKCLIDHGADINSIQTRSLDDYGRTQQVIPTPLHIAAEHGHTHIVDWLIQQGANINEKGQKDRNDNPKTPFELSCQKGKLATAALLAKKGATSIRENYEALIPESHKRDTNEHFTALKNMKQKIQNIEHHLNEMKNEKIEAQDVEKIKAYIFDEETPTCAKQQAVEILAKNFNRENNKDFVSENNLKNMFKKIPFNKDFLDKHKEAFKLAAAHNMKDQHGKSIITSAITHCKNKKDVDRILSHALPSCGTLYRNTKSEDFKQWLQQVDDDTNENENKNERNELATALKSVKTKNPELYRQMLNRMYAFYTIEKTPVPKENTTLPTEISSKIVGFLDNKSLSDLVKSSKTKGKK